MSNILTARKYAEKIREQDSYRSFTCSSAGLLEYHANHDLEVIREAGIIAYDCRGRGLTTRDDWQYYEWSCTITTVKGSQRFAYFTGTAHIAYRIGPGNYAAKKPNRVYRVDPTPYGPGLASLLYGLCSDATLSLEPFDHFCDNLGYDSDSIKALGLYQECCKTRQELLKLGIDPVKIQELLADF